MSVLDPRALAAIHDLELVARVTVEGALSGLHRSPFHGYSAEFSQYRHYRPGDDLKYVDWKLFARTDRIYTKQFRETTNARLQIVLDASASMRFGSGVDKLTYARLLAAGLAHLVITQGDAAGLMVHDGERHAYLAPRGGRTHLRALLVKLSAADVRRDVPLKAEATKSSVDVLRRAVDLLETRGIIAVISDLYDDEDGVDAELRRASKMGHDVVLFHVLTPEELELPMHGASEFEDLETGARLFVGPESISGYATKLAEFLERWRTRCAAYGVDYVLVRTDLPLDVTLRAYLLRRGRTIRR